jgi:electron transfer flavoprotein-quinone oxidoreductase
MGNESVKVDAVIVGAGPAGLMAAYTIAKGGLDVVVVERGAYAGAKNLSGLLYSDVLEEVMADFSKRAPLERPVSRRLWGFLGSENHGKLEIGCRQWSEPPFNHTWVIYRSRFDRWLAKEVEEEGANILDGMVVDDLIYEDKGAEKRVAGVMIRDDEPIYSDVVILAEGAMGILTQRASDVLKMRRPLRPQVFGLGVKEIWGLPAGVIEDRFHLEPHEGAAHEWVGGPFKGLVGGGFIYTGRESLAVGVIATLESMKATGTSPHDLMDAFKGHREIRRYLEGGELLEYGAHILPEGGYPSIGQLVHNGLIVVGDAAGLVNATIYHEGANLAMASGILAGSAVLRARERGLFSREALSEYEKSLWNHRLMEDLRHARRLREAHAVYPRVMEEIPERALGLIVDFYSKEPMSKKSIKRMALRRFLKEIPKLRTLRDLWHMRRLLG